MKVSFWKLSQSLIVPILICLPAGLEAASAFGRVSANIVASASTSLSGSIILSNQASEAKLSTDGMDKAGLSVSSSGDMVYHVTISSTKTVKDTTGRSVKVEKLQLSSVSNQVQTQQGLAHYVSGAFSNHKDENEASNPLQVNPDPYANMINITVNYN